MQKTILLTGGAGFIGSHLLDDLLCKQHQVVVLDDLSGGKKENLHTDAIFHQGSILDQPVVDELFSEYNFDAVFHLAAYAAEGLSHFIRKFNYQNNVIGSMNLINASVKYGVKHFVFTSSVAIYGSGELPFTESTTPHPEDPYGIAKYAVELDLKAAQKQFGLNYTIFRPHNVYGERQNMGDKYRNVIGIFMNQLMKGKPLTIYGNGEQTRSFTYVKDIVKIMVMALENHEMTNQIFNLGADQPISINQLAEQVQKAMSLDGEIQYLKERNEVVHAQASHKRIEQTIGEQNYTPFNKGLQIMVKWAKEHGVELTTDFTNIELTKNLPKNWQS